MHASYTILWLLLCVHESQYVEYGEEDYTDCNIKENEELLYFNNIFNFTEKNASNYFETQFNFTMKSSRIHTVSYSARINFKINTS